MSEPLQFRRVSVKRRDPLVQKQEARAEDIVEVPLEPTEHPPIMEDDPPLVQHCTAVVHEPQEIGEKPDLPRGKTKFRLRENRHA